MLLDSILNHFETHRKVRRADHGQAGRRPRFETLEDRCLLSLTAAINYPVGIEPQAVVAGDFNNDGRLDLATADSGDNAVSVLIGNGDGTFQSPVTSAATAAPRSLAVGDFNADGNLDLAVVNAYTLNYDYYYGNSDPDPSNGVSVMLGNGDGSFQAPSNVPLDRGAKATSLAVGDFNEDGMMDFAVTADFDYAYPGDVYLDFGQAKVLLAIGDGSFSSAGTFFWNSYPINSVVVADVDRDGHQDLVAGTYYSDGSWSTKEAVRVLKGDGAGNLAEIRSVNWVIDHGTSMAARDINGDLKIDLVTADGNDVNVRLGDGAGGFEAPPGGQSYFAGTRPTSLVLGDFNRDGKLDVATANWGSHDVSILRGFGDGRFSDPEHFAAGLGAYAVAAGDFNGDGWLDVATANATGNNVSVLLNNQPWAPPPVSISVSDASITEGKRGIKYMTFTVSLSAASTGPVTVNYATQNGSATAGSDYQSQSGTLSFAAGEMTTTVRIAIFGDSTVEADESFQLVLSNVTGNAIISDPLGVGLILNDDAVRGHGKKK